MKRSNGVGRSYVSKKIQAKRTNNPLRVFIKPKRAGTKNTAYVSQNTIRARNLNPKRPVTLKLVKAASGNTKRVTSKRNTKR